MTISPRITVRVAQWDVDIADAHLESFKTIGLTMQPEEGPGQSAYSGR